MAADVGKNNNFDSVKYVVTLDLENFNTHSTDMFYVGGIPWTIVFYKFDSENEKSGLIVFYKFLHWKINETLKDIAVVGSFEVEIFSNKFDGKSRVTNIEPKAFEVGLQGYSGGCENIITWDDLIDPENGYLYNNKCRVAVNVNSSPLQIPNDGKWFEFFPVTKFQDCCTKGEFQIKFKNVFEFVDVCTPRFTLKHSPWRLILFRKVTTKNDKIEDILVIKLCKPSFYFNTEDSFKVSMICKLVSSDPTIEPFSKIKEYTHSGHSLDLLSWNELLNPQNKFVENNSFILKIKVEIKDKEDADKDDKPGANTLECPICFEYLIDQPLSVLICGHLFCSACIAPSLERKRNCPSCDRDIPEGELQKVYLPTK